MKIHILMRNSIFIFSDVDSRYHSARDGKSNNILGTTTRMRKLELIKTTAKSEVRGERKRKQKRRCNSICLKLQIVNIACLSQ